jgi:hypothetical protein
VLSTLPDLNAPTSSLRAVPEQVTKLQIFVASPGDVEVERERLKQAVDELNLTLGRTAKLYLELVQWKTHAWPGFGDDAQAVINRQIQPYDIFVGIMWTRLGTPTQRSASGTVEEFERAHQRWSEHGRPTILFYFNTAPPPANGDPEQLQAVEAFKRFLDDHGLYWEYDGADEFERSARQHLYQEISALLSAPPMRASPAVRGRAAVAPRIEDGPSGVEAKLADGGFLAGAEKVEAVANAQTLVRDPGWSTEGVSRPTLMVATNRRLLWWFLSRPGHAHDPQSIWWIAYEQISGVRYSNLRIDPFRPKLTISHTLPVEPRTIRSSQLTPGPNAKAIREYVSARVPRR